MSGKHLRSWRTLVLSCASVSLVGGLTGRALGQGTAYRLVIVNVPDTTGETTRGLGLNDLGCGSSGTSPTVRGNMGSSGNLPRLVR